MRTLLVLGCLAGTALAEPPSIRVDTSVRHRFDGFGIIANDPKAALEAVARADHGLRYLALPLDLRAASPKEGERDLAAFKASYLDLDLPAKAKAAGVTELILLPHGVPEYMLANERTPAADDDRPLVYEFVPKYAILLADVVGKLKENKVEFAAVNVAGQTPHITPDQWGLLLSYLPEISAAKGLAVSYGAGGWPAGHRAGLARLEGMRKSSAGWATIGAVVADAPTSWAEAADFAKFLAKSGKPLWLIDARGADDPAAVLDGLGRGVAVWLSHRPVPPQVAAAFPRGCRIHPVTAPEGIAGSAATLENGDIAVVLCRRPWSREPIAVEVNVPNRDVGDVAWRVRSGDKDEIAVARGGVFQVTVPASGVVTAMTARQK